MVVNQKFLSVAIVLGFALGLALGPQAASTPPQDTSLPQSVADARQCPPITRKPRGESCRQPWIRNFSPIQ